MNRAFFCLAALILSSSLIAAAQSRATAEDILAQAKSEAAEQHKNIQLVFGASWCGYCKRYDAFIKSPEIRPLMEKNFVTAHISVEEELGKKPFLNSPHGAEMLAEFGGGPRGGIPFIVYLDPTAKLIIDSNRVAGNPKARGNSNIGYPTTKEEVEWFITMLKRAAPLLTDADIRAVKDRLKPPSGR